MIRTAALQADTPQQLLDASNVIDSVQAVFQALLQPCSAERPVSTGIWGFVRMKEFIQGILPMHQGEGASRFQVLCASCAPMHISVPR